VTVRVEEVIRETGKTEMKGSGERLELGPWASIQDSRSGPVDGQAVPTGHSQLLGWVLLLLGEGERGLGVMRSGKQVGKNLKDSMTLHSYQSAGLFPTYMVS
jgi:hypothetical protein